MLFRSNYNEGTTYEGTTPSKEADNTYTYTFVGWSTEKNATTANTSLANVTTNLNVYAAFSETYKEYTVTWDSENVRVYKVNNYGISVAVPSPETSVEGPNESTDKYAPTGDYVEITSGATLHYGDVIWVSTNASEGYNKTAFVVSGIEETENYGDDSYGVIVGAVAGNVTISYAEEEATIFAFSEVEGGYAVTGLNEKGSTATELNIPAEYKGLPVLEIGTEAFNNNTKITSVTIPDSVTSIGEYAFLGCTRLTEITIGEGVTSIGSLAFCSCTSLTSITIPEKVTSIGNNAFGYCSSLTSITIPEGITSIGDSTFYNCTSLTEITIPDSVTSIGDYAFYSCTSLTDRKSVV